MNAFFAPALVAGRVYFAEAVPPSDTVVVPNPTVTGVTINPVATTVLGNGTQQFTANVLGTNSPPQSFNWTKTGAGTLSSTGLFSAPVATDQSQTITITATSTFNETKSATAVVVIPAEVIAIPVSEVTGVTLTPLLPTISNDSPLQFTATVEGTNNPSQAVTWELAGPGTLSNAGLYVPPAKLSTAQGAAITAVSVQNPSKSKVTVVTIPPTVITIAPVITGISITPSSTIPAGGNKQVIALLTGTSGFNPAVMYAITPINGSVGATIDSFGFFQAPSSYLPQQFDVVATSVQDSNWKAVSRVTVQALVVIPPYVPNSRMLVVSPKGKPHNQLLQNEDCAFIVRQGFPMIEKDPNSRLAYGMDLSLYLAEISATVETATCVPTGVKVNPYEVSIVNTKVLFWATAGDPDSSDNMCVIRFTCSDGTEDDRTMYFRISDL